MGLTCTPLVSLSLVLASVSGEGLTTLYTATVNQSSSSWVSRVVDTRPAASLLSCAGHCQDRQEEFGDCNSFAFEEASSSCQMGSITYLEDPSPGDSSVRLMVVEEVLDSLKMWCRGGDGCCGTSSTRLCQEGEGDCDEDAQCAGVLQCGTDNCPTSGGHWDDTDDCCQARCTPDRQCEQGWGPCTDSTQCQGSENGYNVCANTCLGANIRHSSTQMYSCYFDMVEFTSALNFFLRCLMFDLTDRSYYPLDAFPRAAEIFGYSSTDLCCRRRCYPQAKCGHDQIGKLPFHYYKIETLEIIPCDAD